MYCSNCGKKISDTSRFCRYCGAPVEQEEGSFSEKDNRTDSDDLWPGLDDFGLDGGAFTEAEDFDYEDTGYDADYFLKHGKNRKRERDRTHTENDGQSENSSKPGDDFEGDGKSKNSPKPGDDSESTGKSKNSSKPGNDSESGRHHNGTGSNEGQTRGKKNRRTDPNILLFLGILGILGLFLFWRIGPGGVNSPTQESGGSAAASKGELTVCIWDESQRAGLQQIFNEWTAESGVKVNMEFVSWNDYWTELENHAAAGDLPDIFWMHSAMAHDYMEKGLLLNLDDYIASDDAIDLANYYEEIVDIYRYPENGTQYALPKDHDTIALLYKKAVFDECGLTYPSDDWTWEDFCEAAACISDSCSDLYGLYGFAMDVSDTHDGWYNIVYGYGGQILTNDDRITSIGSPEGIEGMEMVRRILEVSAPFDVVSENGTENMFLYGQCAMIMQGSWMANYYYNNLDHDSYGWAMLPYADTNYNGICDEGERCSIYNGIGWAAAADTDMPDEAYSLISYLCSEAGQKKQAELGISMAGMKGFNEEFLNAFEEMDVSAFVRIEEEGTLCIKPYTKNIFALEDAILGEAFLAAWENPSEPEAMEDACYKAHEIIKTMVEQE